MPPAPASLDALLQDRQVWRGRGAADWPAESTGHAALDAALPGSGWPIGALTEVLVPADGLGELSLVLPLLVRLSAAGRGVAYIGAPYLLYPPALVRAGADCHHIHRIQPRTDKERLWAAEVCLQSGACGAVLLWPGQADDTALRRLQLAAEEGKACGFVFRHARLAAQASPAVLRVQLQHAPGFDPDRDDPAVVPGAAAAPRVQVLKCRGGIAQAGLVEFGRADWA